MIRFVFLLSLICSLNAFSSQYPRVDAALKQYDAEIAKDNAHFNLMPANPHDIHWVTLKVSHMTFIDQYMREFIRIPKLEGWNSEETSYFWKGFMPRWRNLDETNTNDLKALLTIYGWMKISLFGNSVDSDAWLLVQHADLDLAFQQSVLAILTTLYPIEETRPRNYAMLYDRVAVNSKQPFQKFGSQGSCQGNKWDPYPIEDFAHVNDRRAEMGMETFEKNKARLDKICSELP